VASAKPKSGLGAPKPPAAAKFVLGSRPTSLRQKQPTAPKAATPNTRDYGKPAAPAPSTTLQPGAPLPAFGNGPSGGLG